jgi:phenylacetate-CoA ligase
MNLTDLSYCLYRHMPSPLRFVAASLRGFYLRSWRYGPETARLVREAIEREHWSLERWKTWQEERLAYVLHRAATQVPYYRDQWAKRRRWGDKASWECLENWPILEKESLRAHPTAFVAEDCDVRRMFHEHTSGTSGTSLDLWWSLTTVRAWYALFEARSRCWNGVSNGDRWGIFGGQLITPIKKRQPPFWVWNMAFNQLYLSSYHLASDLISHYLDALRHYRISYLFGYTSSLYLLADEALRLGRRDLKMTVAITNAEPVFDYQRQAIAEAFQCPVRESYGMAEIIAAASECQEGQLHMWPEVGWVEVLAGDQPVVQGTPGDFVCTGLLNADMPLIRYRVGDRGALAGRGISCACERSLPMLASIDGRVDDLLYTADGRRIGRLDPVFKAHLPVREAQIIQEALDRVRVRYVPAPDFTPQAGRSIIERLQTRMGPVDVILERVDEVPREANGKFRAVLSMLSAAERRSLDLGT